MATDNTELDRRPTVPGRWLYLTEPARAAVDVGLLTSTAPLLSLLPRGDSHPVLVLPGLGAADTSTLVLRRVLRRLGYRMHGWRLGTNLGPTPRVLDGMASRVEELTDRYQEPMSVIGWSLGGFYARQLAWRSPESVRQVITLGTPVRLAAGMARQRGAAGRPSDLSGFPQWPRWSQWARWYGDFQARVPDEPAPGGEAGLPVPTTSIYSVLDGIVGWRVCLTDAAPQAENIGVAASHIGFAYHPAVIFAIADRLAQATGVWRPFRPPALLRAAYT